jgi:hypothetical protein
MNDTVVPKRNVLITLAASMFFYALIADNKGEISALEGRDIRVSYSRSRNVAAHNVVLENVWECLLVLGFEQIVPGSLCNKSSKHIVAGG